MNESENEDQTKSKTDTTSIEVVKSIYLSNSHNLNEHSSSDKIKKAKSTDSSQNINSQKSHLLY